MIEPLVNVEPMTAKHGPAVLRIYAAGILTGNATFETDVPDWASWDATHLSDHRFVSVDPEAGVTGWVALVPVSDRCAYRGVVEHSVYVHPAYQGRGIGRALLETVIASTEAAGIWTIQSGIFPENAASLRLHEQLGFRVVGVRERLGRLDSHWRDVVLLERRSPRIS